MSVDVEDLQRLSDLQSRLERLEAIEGEEKYEDDGNFVAFTIRDARRTVPNNVVPYGFHVFDIVNLDGGSFGGFMDRDSERDSLLNDQVKTNRATIYHNGYALPASFQSRCQTYNVACYRIKVATIFEYLLNLKGLSQNRQNDRSSNIDTKSNLRSSPSSSSSSPITSNTTYFFYMESDNNLCVPLTEVRRLAYKYQRYFISTGVGFSGYIMNRTFVQDFVKRYEGKDSRANIRKRNIRHTKQWEKDHAGDAVGGSDTSHSERDDANIEIELRPDVVAGQLLIEKQAWSVTRRYLTSHTVLQNSPTLGGEGMPSLTNLFDGRQHYNSSAEDEEEGESHNDQDGGDEQKKENEDEQGNKEGMQLNSTTIETEKTLVNATESELSLGISRHLPRCLEPHRGIWWMTTADSSPSSTSNSTTPSLPNPPSSRTDAEAVRHDLEHWNFFAYDLCPDSEIFPCKEGQLSKLYPDIMASTKRRR